MPREMEFFMSRAAILANPCRAILSVVQLFSVAHRYPPVTNEILGSTGINFLPFPNLHAGVFF
jgi:hypothetical protein